MPEIKISVEFTISDTRRDQFLTWLQGVTSTDTCPVIGYRADDFVARRSALTKFVDAMEAKLRKNDHKTTWRDKPIEALVGLMKLELTEFDIALAHFTVGETRPELVDVANFALICWDRLSMYDQDQNLHVQGLLSVKAVGP